MSKLIQDIVPTAVSKKLPPSAVLIAVLYSRGVSIEDIFSRYYEYDAHADARNDELFGNDEEGQHGKKPGRPRLTVGDARLATGINFKPGVRQPF